MVHWKRLESFVILWIGWGVGIVIGNATSSKDTKNSTHGVQFDEFLNAYMSEDRPHFARVGDQSRFFQPRPNDAPVDHLFQYEQMDLALGFLEDRIGRKIQLPHKNVSPKLNLPVSNPCVDAFEQYAASQFALWHAAKR